MAKPFITALTKALGLIALAACLVTSRAYGDVGVILNETLNESVARVTGSGHTAVYFSRICPDTPIKLRLCRPGENGSVMSNYINLWRRRALRMEHRAVQPLRLRRRRSRRPPRLRHRQNQSRARTTLPRAVPGGLLHCEGLLEGRQSGMARNGRRRHDPQHVHLRRRDHRATGRRPDREIQRLAQ